MEKNELIEASLRETKERRKTQLPRVYQLKLQNLSKKNIEILDRLFLETKWLRNYVIADIPNRLKLDTWKMKKVEVKVRDKFEERELMQLSSQMKQSVVDRIKEDLLNLHKAKEKGIKVGAIQFKSEVNSIPLKQYGNTYEVDFEHNRAKIQGIKKHLRVLGLHQIPDGAEITKGELIKKPSGYYLYVIVFLNEEPAEVKTKKDKIKEKYIVHFNKPLGIDFGIKDQLSLSNGIKMNYEVKESKRLKVLQRKLAKQEKCSSNFRKTVQKVHKEYENLFSIKKDMQNRIFAFTKLYVKVYTQNDNIKGWHAGLFGRKVQHTGIGGIISRLKNNLKTLVLVDRYISTTQTCSNCGHRQSLSLSDRVFRCEKCRLEIDRDINSAINMIQFGGEKTPKNLGLDWTEVTPVERKASMRILESNPYIRVSYASLKQEALSF